MVIDTQFMEPPPCPFAMEQGMVFIGDDTFAKMIAGECGLLQKFEQIQNTSSAFAVALAQYNDGFALCARFIGFERDEDNGYIAILADTWEKVMRARHRIVSNSAL